MPVDLLHICVEGDWNPDAPEYTPPRYDTDGFIHLSRPDQVHRPATRLYRGRTDLILLVIDGDRLGDELRWEPSAVPEEDGELFPHLYRPIDTDEVTAVVPYRPGADGRFANLPA